MNNKILFRYGIASIIITTILLSGLSGISGPTPVEVPVIATDREDYSVDYVAPIDRDGKPFGDCFADNATGDIYLTYDAYCDPTPPRPPFVVAVIKAVGKSAKEIIKTLTPTVTPTSTVTLTPTSTDVPTDTPEPTVTIEPTIEPTLPPTETPEPTVTPEETPTPTEEVTVRTACNQGNTAEGCNPANSANANNDED